MKTTYKITNEEKAKSIRIFTDGVKCTDLHGNFKAEGTLTIISDGDQKDITGEHGSYDYEEEYGFILIAES